MKNFINFPMEEVLKGIKTDYFIEFDCLQREVTTEVITHNVDCPTYERMKKRLDADVERERQKVDRLKEQLKQCDKSIQDYKLDISTTKTVVTTTKLQIKVATSEAEHTRRIHELDRAVNKLSKLESDLERAKEKRIDTQRNIEDIEQSILYMIEDRKDELQEAVEQDLIKEANLLSKAVESTYGHNYEQYWQCVIVVRNFCEVCLRYSNNNETKIKMEEIKNSTIKPIKEDYFKEGIKEIILREQDIYNKNNTIYQSINKMCDEKPEGDLRELQYTLEEKLSIPETKKFEFDKVIDPVQLGEIKASIIEEINRITTYKTNLETYLEETKEERIDIETFVKTIEDSKNQMNENIRQEDYFLRYFIREINQEGHLRNMILEEEVEKIKEIIDNLYVEDCNYNDIISKVNANSYFINAFSQDKEDKQGVAAKINSLYKTMDNKIVILKRDINHLNEQSVEVDKAPEKQANSYINTIKAQAKKIWIPLLNLWALLEIVKVCKTYFVGVESGNSFFLKAHDEVFEVIKKCQTYSSILLGILLAAYAVLMIFFTSLPVGIIGGIVVLIQVITIIRIVDIINKWN